MRTLLKKNDINILKYLSHNNNVSTKDIAQAINKSETCIRNSIKNINTFFEENNLTPLERIDGKYNLSFNISNNLSPLLLKDSIEIQAKERFNYLMFELILTEKLNLNKKTSTFNVTRKTLSLDLEEIKNFLAQKDLYLESIPWKGIYLKGDQNNKIILSIKFLLKLILEKEFNPFSSEINKTEKLYHQYLPIEIEKKLFNLNQIILKKYNLNIGTQLSNVLLAVLIYCYLKKDSYILAEEDPLFSLKNVKEIYNSYFSFFCSEEFLKEYPFFHKNSHILSSTLTRITPEILKIDITNDNIMNNIISNLESNLNFKFTESSNLYFIQLLRVGNFKYKYNITHFNSFFEDISEQDKYIIDKLNSILIKNNINLLYEDLTLPALIIKHNIVKYKIQTKQKHILILDRFLDCWLGNLIQNQLLNNFEHLNIAVKSIYLLNSEDILLLNPDFIIYTDFEFDNFFPNINIKKQQCKYDNIFKNINYLEDFEL